MAKKKDTSDKDRLKLARERFDQAETTDGPQLQRELDDIRFYADDQWPANIQASRAGQNGTVGLPPIPARPCLVINKLRDPIRHVEAEAQQTDLAPEIVPADDFSGLVGPIDDTEIELREGLVRKIQRESGARDARNWAAARARIAGRGYYVVMTRYCSNRSMDQEVYVSGLYNQSTVRLDPSHEQADGSDAEWGFYGTTMSWGDYKAQHPERASKPKGRVLNKDDDNEEWRGLGDEAPDWFTGEGETRSVRVMNYFYTERDAITLVELESGALVDSRELQKTDKVAKDEDGKRIERRDVEKTIQWAKIDGAQILEETEWESPYIPIIKVVGEELQPYDKERRYQGMVRPARDAQFGFDVMATTEVEVALLAPKTPIVAYAGQFEGFEEAWDQANIRNIGRLEVNAKTDQMPAATAPLPLPQALVRNTDIGTWDGLRNMFDQAIRATTGVPDATLGNVDPSVRSGRGIRALQDAASQGTSGYLANLVKSVTYEAKIINSLLYPIYGRRKGRLLQMMTGKHESTGVMVGQPFVRDAKQRPVAFDPQQHQGQQPKEYALTEDATFNVAIRVSKDYDTRRQEEASTLGELINANPQLMAVFGDLFFENQDGPGHKDMAERAKLMLDPRILASLNKGQSPIPPEVQAQMQQMQQQLQQATQFIQTKQAEQQGQIEQAKIKAAADVQTEQLKADLQIRLKEMDNAKAIAVARIGAAKSALDIQAEAAEERLATGIEQSHEVALTAMEQQHEREMAQHQAAIGQAQQGAQMGHEQQMAEQAAAQAAQQQGANGAGV